MKTQKCSVRVLGAVLLINLALGLPRCANAQGSLTPPGAPTPTMKTLAQIEPRVAIASLPYTISQPGSYYLTTNLTGVSGNNGITIASGGVTLDLNGFALLGVPGSSNAVDVPSLCTNLTVRNGTVRGWGNNGVEAYNAQNTVFERLAVSAMGGFGIEAYGSVVRDCVVDSTGDAGIVAYVSEVSHCVVENSGYDGIDAYDSQVRDCVVEDNDYGIYTERSTVSSCFAAYNYYSGIYVGEDGCQIIGNTCLTNNLSGSAIEAGIYVAASNNRLENNHVTGSGHAGIQVAASGASRNIIIRNSVAGNAANNFITPGTQIVGPLITATGTINNSNPWANFSY